MDLFRGSLSILSVNFPVEMQWLCNIANTIFHFFLFLQESNYCVGVGRDIFTNNPKTKTNNSQNRYIDAQSCPDQKVGGDIRDIGDISRNIDSHYRHDPVLRSANLWQDSETRVSSLDWRLETGDTSSASRHLRHPAQTWFISRCVGYKGINIVWELLLFIQSTWLLL